jgi:hypothetical protein
MGEMREERMRMERRRDRDGMEGGREKLGGEVTRKGREGNNCGGMK